MNHCCACRATVPRGGWKGHRWNVSRSGWWCMRMDQSSHETALQDTGSQVGFQWYQETEGYKATENFLYPCPHLGCSAKVTDNWMISNWKGEEKSAVSLHFLGLFSDSRESDLKQHAKAGRQGFSQATFTLIDRKEMWLYSLYFCWWILLTQMLQIYSEELSAEISNESVYPSCSSDVGATKILTFTTEKEFFPIPNCSCCMLIGKLLRKSFTI